MKDFGSPTPKRHLGYSNAKVVEKLCHGYLTYSGQSRLKPAKTSVAIVKKYTDKKGKKRFSGTAYLKLSQQDPQLIVVTVGCFLHIVRGFIYSLFWVGVSYQFWGF